MSLNQAQEVVEALNYYSAGDLKENSRESLDMAPPNRMTQGTPISMIRIVELN